MSQTKPPALVGVTPGNFPTRLTSRNRWAVWAAVWSEKRQKYDKIPKHPTGYGISTMRPEKWCDYQTALSALVNPAFAGVGYLMTGGDGLVGIDLDKCVVAGVIAPWAQAIVDQVDSYAELSPSGNGVRIFTEGTIAFDWTNHAVGIEVYAGHTARFLTVTGAHLTGTPAGVMSAPAGVLASLATSHAKERESATVISMSMPEIADPLALPDLSELGLPYKVMDYLTDGTPPSHDRSLSLFTTATALHSAGLDTETVFSILANNPYTMDDALGKRHQDVERALLYLWVHHAQKSKDRATSPLATLADFEDVSPKSVADDFEDVSGPRADTPQPKLRFNIQQAGAFAKHTPVRWHIKGVLPRAEVSAIIGESGSGKTFFILDMLMAIATGTAWRGRRVAQCAVLYICAEGAGGFRTRLHAYAKEHGVDLGTLPLYVLGDAPNLMEKGDVKDLLTAIRALPQAVGVICADTWAQVTAGANENSGEDMGRALSNCKALNRASRASIVLVAHTGKVADRGMRGWSGVKGALDAEITVERSGQYRSATITKMKDGSDEGAEFGFDLQNVDMGVDDDGDPVTSCVVRAKEGPARPDRKVSPKGSVEKLALQVAENMLDLGGTCTVDQLTDAVICEIPEKPGKRDQRNGVVSRAIASLVAGKWITTTNGIVKIS
jgi:hypothetical protein